MARRLEPWVAEQQAEAGDRLIVMHGMSSRVLRGLLTGLPERPGYGCPIAGSLPQGAIVCVEGGVERVVNRANALPPGSRPSPGAAAV